jgi:hypothetical protein
MLVLHLNSMGSTAKIIFFTVSINKPLLCAIRECTAILSSQSKVNRWLLLGWRKPKSSLYGKTSMIFAAEVMNSTRIFLKIHSFVTAG